MEYEIRSALYSIRRPSLTTYSVAGVAQALSTLPVPGLARPKRDPKGSGQARPSLFHGHPFKRALAYPRPNSLGGKS